MKDTLTEDLAGKVAHVTTAIHDASWKLSQGLALSAQGEREWDDYHRQLAHLLTVLGVDLAQLAKFR